MRRIPQLMTLSILLAASGPCVAQAQLETDAQKLSYSVGVLFARNMALETDVDNEAFLQGIRDVLEDAQLKLPPEEMQRVVQAYRAEQIQRQNAAAQANETASAEFLTANKKKEGVVELENGLQYKVMTMGDGKKPALSDTITVHYRGTLVDGTEFDSSYSRGEPTTFPLENVIPGWQQALQLMPVGSKWQVYIPPSLAYGDRGAGDVIGPNSTLIFDIELISIN